MPDRNKFMQMKAQFESLGQMMADYEKDFGDSESEDSSEFNDQDENDGGQKSITDMEPEVDSGSEKTGTDKKKKAMAMMSSMLKGKMSSKGY